MNAIEQAARGIGPGAAGRPAQGPGRAPPLPGPGPLSHHDIMRLVAPFTLHGYVLDLAASDRTRRMLRFRPRALPHGDGALQCRYALELVHRAKARVTRTLQAADGREATVTAAGPDPAALLDAAEAIGAARQFRAIDGAMLTRSYHVSVPSAHAGRRASDASAAPAVVRAEARVDGITLLITAAEGRSFDVGLAVEADHRLDVTADLLAVLGWCWRPLRREGPGAWRGSVRPGGRGRTARLESQLDAAVAHLVATFASPPRDFHARHARARWRAGFQRLLPLLTGAGIAAAFVASILFLPRTPLVHMLLTQVPLLAIVALSLIDRSYRLEVPPVPRPLLQSRWWAPLGQGDQA